MIKEWVRGRNEAVREKEDRATAEAVLRDLDEGIWMDRDGDPPIIAMSSSRVRIATSCTTAEDLEPLPWRTPKRTWPRTVPALNVAARLGRVSLRPWSSARFPFSSLPA